MAVKSSHSTGVFFSSLHTSSIRELKYSAPPAHERPDLREHAAGLLTSGGREYFDRGRKTSVTILFTAVLLLAFFLILSCQPQKKAPETAVPEMPQEATAESCAPHWECADENYARFQAENCSWNRPEKCERGCFNGTCKPAEICAVGYKCIDDFRRGYQKEDCSFFNKIDCEWGCEEGKCLEKTADNFTGAAANTSPQSQEYSAIAENQDDKEVEKEKTIYPLKVGEQQQIEFNGAQVNVSIHLLEPSQVTLKVNGIKSDTISEQGNFTYGNIGAVFRIEWIAFQAYAGGKQEIGYSVEAVS